jgi:septum formation protein
LFLQPPRPLWLASTSRYRRALLARLGVEFEVAAPEVAEHRLPGEAPAELARRLALAKARAVAERHPDALVIGSDQVCALGDTILGKPADAAAARAQLAAQSGQVVSFHTAVAMVGIAAGCWRQHLDETRCRFRVLDTTEIADYIAAESPLDCAGSFKIEGLGIALFERVESVDPTALVGLPLIWVAQALREVRAMHAGSVGSGSR